MVLLDVHGRSYIMLWMDLFISNKNIFKYDLKKEKMKERKNERKKERKKLNDFNHSNYVILRK